MFVNTQRLSFTLSFIENQKVYHHHLVQSIKIKKKSITDLVSLVLQFLEIIFSFYRNHSNQVVFLGHPQGLVNRCDYSAFQGKRSQSMIIVQRDIIS